ncbi:cobalt-precorrin-6A reductase [Clostridium bovifaecis]|uniref:Cobalt-precorrin-6A reductase n=1 Tax=Clostridium bovifaecis TaxID=2184719 RepID=A0A6I6EZK6_9CLOT|nr:cobalt-precorrin-6A reductase [Clostridium bovifaecis]
MIGLILGTSEGKEILSKLNVFTEDIFVTTATSYGGELLKDYKYKHINSSPLTKEGLKEHLIKHKVSILVDAAHPYAVEIRKNTREICKELKIEYLRYERPSVIEEYLKNDNIKLINSIEDIKDLVIENKIQGTILNTTGSRNVDKFIKLGLENRIIHRVLPTIESLEKCLNCGVKVENIVAVKGPIGLDLNIGFIKEYKVEALVLKDSGTAGGTEEKLKAAIQEGVMALVLKRKDTDNAENNFSDIDKLITHIKKGRSKWENYTL